MTTPTTGEISLLSLQNEFGGTNPISISEYYSSGSFVPAGTRNKDGAVIPTAGNISMSTFYGSKKWTKTYQTAGDGNGAGGGSGLIYGAHTNSGGNAGMPGNTIIKNFDTGASLGWQVNCSGSNWFPLIVTLNNNYRLGSSDAKSSSTSKTADRAYTINNVPIFMWRNQYTRWTNTMITKELGMNANQISRSYIASQVWWENANCGMDNQTIWGLAILDSRRYSDTTPGNTWTYKRIVPYYSIVDVGDEWYAHGFQTKPVITNGVCVVPNNFTKVGPTRGRASYIDGTITDYAVTLDEYSLVIPVIGGDRGFSGISFNGARNPFTAKFGYIGLS